MPTSRLPGLHRLSLRERAERVALRRLRGEEPVERRGGVIAASVADRAAHCRPGERAAFLAAVRPDDALHGPAAGETLDDFERRLAALAGLLRDALPAQVVLMTPPPGLLPAEMLPTAQPGGDPMRPHAEAVLRVADALGITVADFYTMCRTREATPAVVDGALTDVGRRLAAESLARTLASGR